MYSDPTGHRPIDNDDLKELARQKKDNIIANAGLNPYYKPTTTTTKKPSTSVKSTPTPSTSNGYSPYQPQKDTVKSSASVSIGYSPIMAEKVYGETKYKVKYDNGKYWEQYINQVNTPFSGDSLFGHDVNKGWQTYNDQCRKEDKKPVSFEQFVNAAGAAWEQEWDSLTPEDHINHAVIAIALPFVIVAAVEVAGVFLAPSAYQESVVVKDALKGGSGTKEIFRAVSPEEFKDIMSTGAFRGIEGKTFAAKEFGNSFDETLNFANKSFNLDKAAIVKVKIPESSYDMLNHMNLDRFIFKSGTPVVEPDMLDMFNKSIISIEHVY